MKNSMVLASSWLTSDSRRIRVALMGVALIAALLGVQETVFAGTATGEIH